MAQRDYEKYLLPHGSSLQQVCKAYEYGLKIGPSPEEAVMVDDNVYLCPLCMRNFLYIRHDEFYQNEDFSLDHFPPESVGGNQKALVCIPCNSNYGRTIDYALKEYLQFETFFRKQEAASYPMKVSYDGIPGEYKINSIWEKGNLLQSVNFKKYPLISKWLLKPQQPEWKFKLRFLGPSPDLLHKALLKTAYLTCFNRLGYEFAMSKTGYNIRKCLEGKMQHPLSNFGVFGDLHATDFNGLYLITGPAEYKSFAVFFDIKIKKPAFSQKVFVLIPCSDAGSWERLNNFKPWIEKKEADMTLLELNSLYINNSNYFAYSQLSHRD
jgi:hypothetical protein